jgi:hypothetical protein
MRTEKLLINDEAVSITIGFTLMLSITVIVFSMLILSFHSFILQSEKISMRESFGILGSGHAARITTVDTLVNLSNSKGWTLNSLEYDFSIPPSIAGKEYVTNITGNKITIGSDNGAKAWIPFTTPSFIDGQDFNSGAQDFKLVYNSSTKMIRIEEQ